jgi:hypothetical protein
MHKNGWQSPLVLEHRSTSVAWPFAEEGGTDACLRSGHRSLPPTLRELVLLDGARSLE